MVWMLIILLAIVLIVSIRKINTRNYNLRFWKSWVSPIGMLFLILMSL